MKLLSRSEYDRRRAELIDAKQLAEAAYRSACFALETETGADADVKKAKSHLDLIEGKLSGLASAWQESQRQEVVISGERRSSAYLSMLSAVDGGLRERAMAIDRLEQAVVDLGLAFAQHQAASRAIRASALDYALKHEGHYRLERLDGALGGGNSIGIVIGTLLAQGGISLLELREDAALLCHRTPAETEALDAAKIKFAAEDLQAAVQVAA